SPHWRGTNFPEFVGNRVLLPESFVWFRLSQICTFGALSRPDRSFRDSSLLPVILYLHCMSLMNQSQEEKYHLIKEKRLPSLICSEVLEELLLLFYAAVLAFRRLVWRR